MELEAMTFILTTVALKGVTGVGEGQGPRKTC